MPIRKVAEILHKNPDTVNGWLLSHGYKKCPNYTEMECYLLSNFSVNACAQFIPHKSKNALKIKGWRLRNAQRKPNSKSDQKRS